MNALSKELFDTSKKKVLASLEDVGDDLTGMVAILSATLFEVALMLKKNEVVALKQQMNEMFSLIINNNTSDR